MPRILLGLIRSWKHCLIWIEGTQVLLGWDFVYSQHSSMNHTFSYLDSSDGFFEEDQALQSSTKQIHCCSMKKWLTASCTRPLTVVNKQLNHSLLVLLGVAHK